MLIGQERAEAALTRALDQDRVSHAYLFVGPESAGKHTAAVLLAQALNCRGEGVVGTGRRGDGATGIFEGNAALDFVGSPRRPVAPSPPPSVPPSQLAPCGQCEDCRRIAAGTHPDVHVIHPGSKTGQNISVEQMRDLRQDVARRPIMGRRKVYLVPNAEAMNDEAANTLLKTLEEPPEYVTLVLMATSPTRVLPTILSRCQVVRFGLAPPAVIQAWLEADGVPAETAAALAVTAGGRPGLARRWSREPEALERRRQALALLAEVAALRSQVGATPGEGIAALRLAERVRALAGPEEVEERTSAAPTRAAATKRRGSKAAVEEPVSEIPPPAGENRQPAAENRATRPGLLRVLEVIRSFYRDLLLLAQGAPETLVNNADSLPALREAAAALTPAELVAALDAVGRCQQFLERNVAPQLALETLFLELMQPAG